MKIKSKAAAKTVTAKKPCVRKAKTEKTAKVAEKSVTFTVRADIGKTV